MTDSGGTRMPSDQNTAEHRAGARIERALGRARLVLIWEAVWPILAPLVTLAGLFAFLSWIGLWRFVSTPVRVAIRPATTPTTCTCR